MAKARKDYRELTVSEATNYGRRTAPMLRIQGLWFQELGFNIGDPVLVKCEDGQIVITKDESLQKQRGAEKEFLETETRKLEKKFEEEKKRLRRTCLAEREGRYGA